MAVPFEEDDGLAKVLAAVHAEAGCVNDDQVRTPQRFVGRHTADVMNRRHTVRFCPHPASPASESIRPAQTIRRGGLPIR
jgi:hypothetical protein